MRLLQDKLTVADGARHLSDDVEIVGVDAAIDVRIGVRQKPLFLVAGSLVMS